MSTQARFLSFPLVSNPVTTGSMRKQCTLCTQTFNLDNTICGPSIKSLSCAEQHQGPFAGCFFYVFCVQILLTVIDENAYQLHCADLADERPKLQNGRLRRRKSLQNVADERMALLASQH